MAYPVVAIVGRPNVGKSTLFNRIAGERISIVEDTPGVTRDRIYTRAEWLGTEFRMIDTGGIDLSDEPFITQITQQAEIAIEEADVIVFITSAPEGVTDADENVAKILYRANKPVLLAVNKADNPEVRESIYDFYSLGLGDHRLRLVEEGFGAELCWFRSEPFSCHQGNFNRVANGLENKAITVKR